MKTIIVLAGLSLLLSCKNNREVNFAATDTYRLSNEEKDEILTRILVEEYESLGLNDSLTPLPLQRCISSPTYRVYIALSINQNQATLAKNMTQKLLFLSSEEHENRTIFLAKAKENYLYGYVYDKKHTSGTVAIFFVAKDSLLIRSFYEDANFLTNKIRHE